ncbi:hypothetical protein BV25DRAFT_1826713 [Artomyces pyxidatus]|uniref:Uncharacterized protein n=2 Tax=Artomyces pyxidatus TaxID=48021 RepID=A0ACB8SF70_9AGAM|nr:hypothetical protein BV25DRAFT_1833612 [Artomyces pyxidatus]KAI0061241.1 hypothetical protein BV25DRAFT_1826713 [Artomyces pyxidatus]
MDNIITKLSPALDTAVAYVPAIEAERPASATERLPAEILIKIFNYCAENVDIVDDYVHIFTASLFTIAQTCGKWRAIALDLPALWTHISFQPTHVTRRMLELSKNEPIISIRADLHKPKQAYVKVVKKALAHAHRASEVTLRCSEWSHMRTLLTGARTPGPPLIMLRLLGPSTVKEDPVLPSSFFDSTAPWSLCTLELANLTIPPGLLPRHCAHLTHLTLRAVGQLSPDAVLAALGAAAETLEALSLQHLPLQPPPVEAPPLAAVITPRLVHVHTDCVFDNAHANAACVLLPLLTLPPHAYVSIWVQLAALASQEDFPPAAQSALAAHATTGPLLKSLILSHTQVQGLRGVWVRAWTAVAPGFFDDMAPPPKLDVRVVRAKDVSAAQMHHALLGLAAALPLGCVQALTLARLPSATAALLKALLAHVPALRELTVHGSAALRALCGGGALGALRPAVELSVYEAAGGADFGGLYEALDARAWLGRRVPRLTVCYSDVQLSALKAIAKLVDDIVWDGSYNGTEAVPIPGEREVKA